MRRVLGVLVLGLAAILTAGVLRAATEPPAWAYAIPPAPPAGAAPAAAPAAPAAPDPTPRELPGSTLKFTLAQIRDGFGPADWFPGDHPTMPEIVAKGKRPDVRACSLCHYPNGKGRPENAGVSGFPVAYFIQTMNDFRGDVRKSAEPRKANTNVMIQIAKGMTEEEIKASRRVLRLDEVDAVDQGRGNARPCPRRASRAACICASRATRPSRSACASSRPRRTSSTPRRCAIRARGSSPTCRSGSIKKGEALVTTGGNGKTVQCAFCHGADLKGLGPVPGIAGRSPSYMVRQMYDMQAGARHGVWTDLMKPVVAKLTDEDFVSIAAYLSSRMP